MVTLICNWPSRRFFTDVNLKDDMKPIQPSRIKIDRDEIDKENKPLISADATFSSAKDVLSSEPDHIAKPLSPRKVFGCNNNLYLISNPFADRRARMRATQNRAVVLTRMK